MAVIPAEKSVRTESDRTEVEEESRSINFGGPRLKLAMQQCLPGYHLLFATDEEIEDRLFEGFTFVAPADLPKQADMGIVREGDVSDRVVRSGGRGVKLFLMKCPMALWKRRQDSIHAEAKRTEDEILGKHTPEGEGEGFRTPTGVKTKRNFI